MALFITMCHHSCVWLAATHTATHTLCVTHCNTYCNTHIVYHDVSSFMCVTHCNTYCNTHIVCDSLQHILQHTHCLSRCVIIHEWLYISRCIIHRHFQSCWVEHISIQHIKRRYSTKETYVLRSLLMCRNISIPHILSSNSHLYVNSQLHTRCILYP